MDAASLARSANPAAGTPRRPPPLPDSFRPPDSGGRIARFFDSIFGFATLVITLAGVSAVPLLNLLSLGYMLEVSARVARSGRLRDGLIGLPRFAAAGKVVLGVWVWTLPIRLVHSYWHDAELIDPGGARAAELRGLLVVMIVVIVLHLAWACIRGGELRHFFWPAPVRFLRWLGDQEKWAPLQRRLANWGSEIRPLHYLWLGVRGFAGAALWLAIPVGILMLSAGASQEGPAALGSLLGGFLLGLVVLYVPFVQTRFAVTGRFGDFFSIGAARALFRRAPLAFWLALFVTLLFALPLYLLKIELAPQEVAWLPNLFFVAFILPARFALGWAMGRAHRRDTPRFWGSRWLARLASVPVVAAYVFIVWLTQYLSWHGSWSLMEQHAFLVPAPMLGL